MTGLVPNILGYHTDSLEKSTSFAETGKMLFSHDVDYLGFGMYFWDNEWNARYWARRKMKNENLDKCGICTANILLDSPYLDLTDKNQITMVKKLWLEYCEKEGTEPKQPLGVILDTLFKYFDDTFQNIKVSKCSGSYKHWTIHDFLSELLKNHIDDRPKIIYSVRCKTKIRNPDLLFIV